MIFNDFDVLDRNTTKQQRVASKMIKMSVINIRMAGIKMTKKMTKSCEV